MDESATGESPEAFLSRHARLERRRQLGWLAGALAAAAAVVAWSMHGEVVLSWLRGETDLQGRFRFRPSHDVSDEAFDSIDMERVHARLLPGWVIAHARARGEGEAAVARTEDAWVELRAAIAPDPNLGSLLDELREHLDGDPLGRRRRIDWLVWAWDDYLDRRGVPYRLEASLHLLPRGVVFSTRSYRVLHDSSWTDDGRRLRTRLLARVDLTNVVEKHLGHSSAGEDGALIVLDRVVGFATREVWPLLDPALDPRLDRFERAFAPAIREDAAHALSARHRALLRSAAIDQQLLVEISEGIHSRRWCGSRFAMREVPWNGLTPWGRRALVRAARRSDGNPGCPEVTRSEAAGVLGASERLAVTRGLEDAVEALVLWVARGIAIHELRHVADEGALSCRRCPERFGAAEIAEVRAYLASFADRETGRVALLQACGLGHSRTLGPNELAFSWLSRRLMLDGCIDGPPPDLSERAKSLSLELFGDEPGIRLAADFPTTIEFLPRTDTNFVSANDAP